jgi:hypothetical protein
MSYSEKEHQIKVNAFEDVAIALRNIYDAKNRDYGDSFSQSFKEEGMAMVRIRLGDKLNRLKNLTRGAEQQVKDESVRDTLMDLANYAIMTIMELDKESTEE